MIGRATQGAPAASGAVGQGQEKNFYWLERVGGVVNTPADASIVLARVLMLIRAVQATPRVLVRRETRFPHRFPATTARSPPSRNLLFELNKRVVRACRGFLSALVAVRDCVAQIAAGYTGCAILQSAP